MKIFAKPTKKEMMLILFLGIVLTIFYYKGLFKEIFIEGSDSSACETLIKEIGVKSFQKVGEEQCTWGRTILKYNLVDEDNDKYGVYCLSSTFSAVTMPKAIATVTCSNYNKIADKADNMNGAELLVGALGSMLSDGKTAYFLTEEEIKAREEDEREKRLIALAADDMGFNEGTIHKCEDMFTLSPEEEKLKNVLTQFRYKNELAFVHRNRYFKEELVEYCWNEIQEFAETSDKNDDFNGEDELYSKKYREARENLIKKIEEYGA